jgi:hypothetical protein
LSFFVLAARSRASGSSGMPHPCRGRGGRRAARRRAATEGRVSRCVLSNHVDAVIVRAHLDARPWLRRKASARGGPPCASVERTAGARRGGRNVEHAQDAA